MEEQALSSQNMGINGYAGNQQQQKYCNFDCILGGYVPLACPTKQFLLQVIASKCVNMLKRLMNPAEDYL